MTTDSYTPAAVAKFCDEARLLGITLQTDVALALLTKVGDGPLCLDALLMKKRPAWLTKIAGTK